MFTVDNFLFCMTLETGALVIAWLSLIGDIIGLLVSVAFVVVLGVFGCEDLAKLFVESGHPGQVKEFEDTCDPVRVVLIIVFIVVAVIAAGFAYISFLCIKGTKARDHVRVRPLMIVHAIVTVLSALSILSFTSQAIMSGVVNTIFYGYCFVVLYSVFSVFKEEYERGMTAQYRQPIAKA